MALDPNALGEAIGAAINAELATVLPPPPDISKSFPHSAPPEQEKMREIQEQSLALQRAVWEAVGRAVATTVCDHLTVHAEVLPIGTPPLAAGPYPVVGVGRVT